MYNAAGSISNDTSNTAVRMTTTSGALVFCVYFLLSFLGDVFLVHGSTASPLWPAAGFGLIATLVFGKIALVPIFLGSLLSILNSVPSWSATWDELTIRCLGYPAANTVESWLTVAFANWLHTRQQRSKNFGPKGLNSKEDILESDPWNMQSLKSVSILTIAIFSGGLISALLGSSVAFILKDSSNLLYATLSWCGADSTAMIIALPIYAVARYGCKRDWLSALAPQYYFAYAAMLVLLSICYSTMLDSDIIREFLLCVIAGVWILFCVQNNLPMLVIGLVMIVGFTIVATVLDFGPFTGRDKQDEYLVMQSYLIVISFCGLSLHALHRETFHMNQLLLKIREAETIKRYESKLEESSRLLVEKQMDLEGILGTFPDLYFWLSREGVYLKYYAHQDLYIAPEYFIGKNVRDVVPNSILPDVLRTFERCCNTRRTEEIEYSLTINGATGWFEGRFTLLANDQVLVVVRNITNRKMTEQQLQSLLIQREIDSEQLEIKAQELARSNSELEQFAYVASHDLREPLRMVRSFCAILDERYSKSLPKEAREYLNFAVDGAKRMQQMVDELLTLSRAGTGQYVIKECSLEEISNRVIETLKHSIEEKGIRIVKCNLAEIHADPDRLEQVLLNLISNAVKFSKNRDGEIRIECETLADEWIVRIVDNGIGIEPKHFDRIFLMFQRLHPQNVYPGTGVGLALCKKIIQQLGGTIGVNSTPDLGSEFWFTLPHKDIALSPESVESTSI